MPAAYGQYIRNSKQDERYISWMEIKLNVVWKLRGNARCNDSNEQTD